ncbi:VPS10 domain-containing protein [Eisenibacter elegans]|uniref:VPS10 domain-containing protein n=1 Tax=Eisenibacter elegans TaxID=997 RepID=UPI000400AFDA|nr:glycosyl hydrolase [Eisenibacter elegans]
MHSPLSTFKLWAVGLWLALHGGLAVGHAQSTEAELLAAAKASAAMRQQSMLKHYPVRSVGPTVMGGRVVDLDWHPSDPNTYYVAYASGGVFKTTNNGGTFEPIFDNQERLTIGDIAVSPADPQVIWVGTGENNSSRSSYAGLGVYRSTDGGNTWTHTGLYNTQHIGRIVAHPTDPNTAWVASIGALYTKNKERGIYKTTDGGKTWTQTLFVNEDTGVIDLVVNPKNPDQLLAGAWQRHRLAWDFEENGPGSGIYASSDGGNTWSKRLDGLPNTQHMGRIGLDVCATQPNVVYMILDNQQATQKERKPDTRLPFTPQALSTMSVAQALAKSNQEWETFLRTLRYPAKYTADRVKQDLQAGRYTPKQVANYFSNANDALFDTDVVGAEVYRSDDFGQTWRKTHQEPLEGVYFTYGYYFGQVRVDPNDANRLYIFGVPSLESADGGKTWAEMAPYSQSGVHVDHHVLLINPKNSNHLILGNDGGLYVSYDRGQHFDHLNNVAVGQFYTVTVDMETPYNIYGGLQDNGVYFGSSKSVPKRSKDWESLMGGDGMYVQVDPRDANLVYTGYQFGNYYRLRKDRSEFEYITPKHEIGEAPLRFNWRTPLLISKHNPDILYIAAQRVYRSVNRGADWQAISNDLTQDRSTGDVPFSTISSLAESPLVFGLLYAGTDDGRLHVSRNGGADWQELGNGLPKDRWVSSIFPSPHAESTVFVTFTGYRNDDITAYLYRSDDYGQSWTSLKGNLPDEAVNILIQDPVNPNLLYLGTDQGAYLSWDGGKGWHNIAGDFPNVATYDLIVHPRENELVIATHGRSIYVMDVKPFQSLKPYVAIVVYPAADIRFDERWGTKPRSYSPVITPELTWMFYLGQTGQRIRAQILDKDGKELRNWTIDSPQPGFQHTSWNLKTNKDNYVGKGTYTLRLSAGTQQAETTVEVK